MHCWLVDTGPDGPAAIDVEISTWAFDIKAPGKAAASTFNTGVLVASRMLGDASLPTNTTRSVWTAIATTAAEGYLEDIRISSTGTRGFTSKTSRPPQSPSSMPPVQQVSGSVKISKGATVSLITAVADNLLKGNGFDPSPEAAALATGTQLADITNEACEFWAEFWGKSSINLPAHPEVEDFW